MALDPTTAELGWRFNDEPKHGPVHRLANNDSDDLHGAFHALLGKQNQPRRRQEVFMEIIHINPTPIGQQTDGNGATDCVYSAELHLLKEKLLCHIQTCPYRWCYVPPGKPDEHIELGYEEINLWARTIHNNEADPECLLPPDRLRLTGLPPMEGRVCTNMVSRSLVPPTDVHSNSNRVLSTANTDQTAAVPGPSTQNLKRSHSPISTEENSDSDGDEEALLLSDVINRLHRKFPRLNLPQYMPLFEQQDIVYAETVANFTKDFYIDLGLTEGAVSQVLSSIKKISIFEKKGRKRVRAYNREYSVEI